MAAPIVLPIAPMVRPSVLDGQENGQLDERLLVPTGIPGLSMVRPAARAMIAMVLVMMAELGPQLVMRQVGGYRDLAGQWRIFGGSAARYRPVSFNEWSATPTNRRKTWRAADRRKVAAALGTTIPESDYWVKIRNADGSYPATAAVPGTSNHGWALAADLAEEYDNDATADPILLPTVLWLIAHAHEFGYSAESQEERWHWRYVAGDAIPWRVLDVEAFLAGAANPPEPTPKKEITMLLYEWRKGTPDFTVVTFSGTHIAHCFDGDAAALLMAAKVPVAPVNDTQLLALIKSAKSTTAVPPRLTVAMKAAWV